MNSRIGQFANRFAVGVSVIALAASLSAKSAEAQVIINDDPNFDGFNEETIDGFINNDQILSGPPALVVNGDLNGDLINNDEMRSSSHGVVVSGEMNGDLTNSAGGWIGASDIGLMFDDVFNGDFNNFGRIDSGDSHAVMFSQQMTGDFTNGADAEIRAGELGVYFSEGLYGDFLNHGEVFSGDSHGVVICYGLMGNFTNTSDALIWGSDMGVAIRNIPSCLDEDEDDVCTTGYRGPFDAMHPGLAMYGNFRNDGIIRGGDSHGVHISGGLIGDFTNSAGAEIIGSDMGVEIRSGGWSANESIAMEGNFLNQGRIESGDSHGVVISGGLVGNFTNAAGARISGSDMGVIIQLRNTQCEGDEDENCDVVQRYGLTGNFLNEGEIIGGDSHGVYITQGLMGDFTNAAGARIIGADAGIIIRRNQETRVGVMGDFWNAGLIDSGDCHGVYISGDFIGDFTNAAGGLIRASEMGVKFDGFFDGDFLNEGEIVGGDSHGVFFDQTLMGNFTNAAGARIWGQENGVQFDANQWYNPESEEDEAVDSLAGNFNNHGEIFSGNSHGVVFRSTVMGNFWNSSTGTIVALNRNGVLQDYNGTGWHGDFTNEGLIEGSQFMTEDGEDYPSIGFGVKLRNHFAGDFTNDGTIRGKQAVFIGGDFTGDYVNRGMLTGAHEGGAYLGYDEDEDEDMYGVFGGFTTVIGGNFDGNLTNTVGHGVQVGIPQYNGEDSELGSATIPDGTGTADFTGHTIGVHVNGIVTNGFSWTAVDAENLLTDPGLTIQDNSFLFDFDPFLNGTNDLILTADQVSTIAAAIGGAAGSLGLAAALDAYVPGTDPDIDDILGNIHSLPTAPEIQQALNEASPAGHASRNSTFYTSTLFDSLLNQRLDGENGGGASSFGLGRGVLEYFIGGDRNKGSSSTDAYGHSGDASHDSVMWLQGMGTYASVDPNGAFGGVDVSSSGVAIGVNTSIYAGTRIAAAFGYHSSNADMTGVNSGDGSDASGWLISSGIHHQTNQTYLSGSVSAGFHSFDETRRDNIFMNTYTASYDGSHFNVSGEVGHEIEMGDKTLTPFIAGTYHHASFDGYTETGGPLALTVGSQSYDVSFIDVGARAKAQVGQIDVEGLLGYRVGFGDGDDAISATLNGTSFNTDANLDVDGVIAGIGVSIANDSGFDASVNYKGIFGDGVGAHILSASVKKRF